MRTAVGVECRSIEDMKPHGSKRGVWWSRINGRCLQRLTLDYDIWRDVKSWFVFFFRSRLWTFVTSFVAGGGKKMIVGVLTS